MSKASELIERKEKETGGRVDSNNYDNMVMASLYGALARELGNSRHESRDDVAVGVLIKHQKSLEEKQEEVERLLGG